MKATTPVKTETASTNILIRRAQVSEAAHLSDLAFRSKGHWGYDAVFLETCRPELTLVPEYVEAAPVFVAEVEGVIAGFYGLGEHEGDADLLFMFVEPAMVGRGIGKALFAHAARTAAELGFKRVRIESDPYAEAFYRAMGARRAGSVPSGSIAGRVLPLLYFVAH